MKLLIKIAIVTGLIVSVSSCQKETLPVPAGSAVQLQSPSSQRLSSDSTDTDNSILSHGQGDGSDIVGGGDGDRDGGRKSNPHKGK